MRAARAKNQSGRAGPPPAAHLVLRRRHDRHAQLVDAHDNAPAAVAPGCRSTPHAVIRRRAPSHTLPHTASMPRPHRDLGPRSPPWRLTALCCGAARRLPSTAHRRKPPLALAREPTGRRGPAAAGSTRALPGGAHRRRRGERV